MIKNKLQDQILLPNKQTKLFFYKNYFDFFINQYKKNLLPNKILLSGQSGLGKSTFAYHFINYILSNNENHPYDINSNTINPSNKSYNLVMQCSHPNFFLVDILLNKQFIDVKQITNMINYANTTSFNKSIKLILIDNAEYLNKYSLNALLKIVEEPNPGTFFFIIHNSSRKIASTLKSRCVEFKISFSSETRQKIIYDLMKYYNINDDNKVFNKINYHYNSPGTTLNLINLIEHAVDDNESSDLKDIILKLMQNISKNKNIFNLHFLQTLIELFFQKKIHHPGDKKKIFYNYSKFINKFEEFKKYNIDMNNTFHYLKEKIIHG